ncbi:MAG: hypothetical protein ABSG43_09980 [Solirubrobacteraceae bacterium]|jgi:hypothetical protein
MLNDDHAGERRRRRTPRRLLGLVVVLLLVAPVLGAIALLTDSPATITLAARVAHVALAVAAAAPAVAA